MSEPQLRPAPLSVDNLPSFPYYHHTDEDKGRDARDVRRKKCHLWDMELIFQQLNGTGLGGSTGCQRDMGVQSDTHGAWHSTG